MKIFSPTMKFIQSESKIVKGTKKWKNEKESKKGHFLHKISCSSHCFAEHIVTNPRYMSKNWRRFMFLRGPYTKTSLTFLIATMDWEILNNIGKHFLQTIPVKSSFCRENCGQQEVHITKLKEFFVPKRDIYKNLSQFVQNYYRMKDKCVSLQPIVQTL